MKVTEVWVNNDPNWKEEELTELCKIVLRELKSSDDKNTQMFWGKIYGKLLGEKTMVGDK